MKFKKNSREAAKTPRNFGIGRAEGAWIRIKMKIKEIFGLGTEDWRLGSEDGRQRTEDEGR